VSASTATRTCAAAWPVSSIRWNASRSWAAAAAAIGGIATGVTGRARWVGIGLPISFVLVLLLAVVIGVQEPALH
jgi:hypothetical protein